MCGCFVTYLFWYWTRMSSKKDVFFITWNFIFLILYPKTNQNEYWPDDHTSSKLTLRLDLWAKRLILKKYTKYTSEPLLMESFKLIMVFNFFIKLLENLKILSEFYLKQETWYSISLVFVILVAIWIGLKLLKVLLL